MSVPRRPGVTSPSHRRTPQPTAERTRYTGQGSSASSIGSTGFPTGSPRGQSAPTARTGSSSAALGAARRSLVHQGVGLVAGSFLLYALASCFVPELLTIRLTSGLHVGELAAAAHVLVIGIGVCAHDWRARRNVDPLAQRVTRRERDSHGAESGDDTDENTGSFKAFDSFRAFGEKAAL